VSCFVNNPKTTVSAYEVLSVCDVLPSLARRTPKIILQRVEEMFPAYQESLVSDLWLKDFSLYFGNTNKIYKD